MPLLEHYRPTWPDPDFLKVDLPSLPARTVADSALKFEFTASFSKGTAEFYKHLQTSPSDIRVKMRVRQHAFILSYFLIVLRFTGCFEGFAAFRRRSPHFSANGGTKIQSWWTNDQTDVREVP